MKGWFYFAVQVPLGVFLLLETSEQIVGGFRIWRYGLILLYAMLSP